MTDAPTLQITSLPTIHPYGWGLLDRFGTPTACRLGTQPTRVEIGTVERTLSIEWVASPGGAPATEVVRTIGWRDLPNADLICPQLIWSANANHLTECAACGVMSLLLHNLEGEVILNVLEIGEGADYLIFRGKTERDAAVEVSGICQVDYPSQSQGRVTEKRDQLLAAFSSGYVSVTTFSHPPNAIVRSFLHFVARPGKRGKKKMQGTVTLPTADPQSAAGLAAAKGQAALQAGDTKTAREKYSEAGALLEGRIGGAEQPDKHWLRFLAASQYYHGGEYRKALALAERVDENRLPPEMRALFPKFFRSTRERAAPDYAQGVRDRLQGHWRRGEYQVVIQGLQQHPYVMERSVLAYLRSYLCQRLGDYRAAATFFASAYQFGVTGSEPVMGAAVAPAQVYEAVGPEAGWESARLAAEIVPHAATAMIASLLSHWRAVESAKGGREEEQVEWWRKQVAYARTAWQQYPHLPQDYHQDLDFRELLALVMGPAAGAAHRLGEQVVGIEMLKAAESLTPRSSEVIGILRQLRQLMGSQVEEPATTIFPPVEVPSLPLSQVEGVVRRVVRRAMSRADRALQGAGV